MATENKYPNIKKFNPRMCISRKLLKCNRIISAIFRKYFLPFGLTNSQISVLFVVSKKITVTQSELVDILSLEKSTVSRNMQRLLQNGLLSKTNQKDIILTEKGKKLLEQIIPEWEKAMAEARAKLADEGEEALNLILSQLVHN